SMAKEHGTSKKNDLRIPPQDIEAEISALGSLLLDHESIYRIADALVATDFYRAAHRTVYEAIRDLFDKREPIDVLSVSARLREKKQLEEIGGMSYLTSMVNSVPTATHIEHYASLVRKKRLLRDLIKASHHIAQLGYREAEDVSSLLDEAEQKIFGIAKDSLKQEFFAVKEALEEAWERIDRIHRERDALRGIPTGFDDIDALLGGLQKSDLVILAARPSLGKTALALDIARNAAFKGHPVGVFSLEMSRDQLVDRLIAAQGNVDLWRLRTGHLRAGGPDDEFSRIRDAMALLSDIPLFLDDTPSPSVIELRAKARRLQAQRKLALVVIDYLQLVKGHQNFESRVQEVSEISRSLKAMAKELNVPVLALSQLSRGVEMRPSSIPKLSDLRESGCLAGDTLITRADTGERIAIRNLRGKTNIPIFSLNKNLCLEIKTISRVFSSGIKQLFEIKTRSGRSIKASTNHPFFTIHGWTPLEKLSKGHHLAQPRALMPIKPSLTLSSDELILLAHLIGDGCVLPRQPIHYTSVDMTSLNIVAETAQRLFSITPRIVPQKNGFHVYLPSPYPLAQGRHHPIINWFVKLGIAPVRSYEKILPDSLFTAPSDQIQLFLHHLWATDGNISWKYLQGRKASAAIYYATTSERLGEQVQHLLLRLGIASTLRRVPQGMHRPNYHIAIQGKDTQLRFLMRMGSFGSRGKIIPDLCRALQQITPNPNTDSIPKEAWRIFIEPEKERLGIGWRELSSAIQTAYCGSTLFKTRLSRSRMTRVAEALQTSPLSRLAQSDIYWDEIISIVPLGDEEVFDATVPGTHNFIANDFIVHNSIEQDADVVMFIYREDKARENTDRKNIAEIRVEKHRNGPTGKVELYFHEETASFRSIAKHFEEPL
ncbi:MAG: replicative DNA helicase, partial [Parcubacteria group bacterium Gr01-1014_66]